MMASILEHLDRLAGEHPDKLLYSYLDVNGDPIESYTYSAFLNRAQAIAEHLRQGGRFAAGDRLLLACRHDALSASAIGSPSRDSRSRCEGVRESDVAGRGRYAGSRGRYLPAT